MKKALSLCLALLMCAALLVPVGSTALAAEDMVPLYASVPEGWEAPCIWAWADDGTGAFSAWPGGEMEDVGEGGWYYCYVPSFVQNVIVNANGGTVQTDGLAVEAGKAVWITVAEDSSAAFTYEAQTAAEIPTYVEKFTVHAYVPLAWETANMWAWSAPDGTNAFAAWPGLSLTEGEDGWFTGKAPVWVNSLIINGNEGTVQTEDISIEGRELWITVYEDLTYDLTYEDPATAGVEDVTVHAQVPEGWEVPSAWAWSAPDGTNAFASWPGQEMTPNGEWYDVTVPGWVNSFIVNANGGTVQTSDLSVEPGKEAWIVVAGPEDSQVYYEEPMASAEIPAETAPAASQTPAEATPAPETETAAPRSNFGLIAGAVAVVAAAGIGGGVVASKKKKK